MARRGRPAFVPTPAQRRQVEELVACSMAVDDIARAIGIAPQTLRLHFADELATGRAKRRAEVIGLLFKSARKGNVAAQKQLDQVTQRSVAEAAIMEGAPDQARPLRRGKKEEAADAALSAGEGSDWGDDLKPGVRPN